MDLQDFPYSGERRPFDWFQEEPVTEAYESLVEEVSEDEAYQSLCVAMMLYLVNRKENYINYMEKGKLIFFACTVPMALKDKAPHWGSDITEQIKFRPSATKTDWSPAYEIQRLWCSIGIHWSWLELAWLDCESAIWDSRNKRLIERLERVR